MSFTITTDVFCDHCNGWMSEGGISTQRVSKREAWDKAKALGWSKQKISANHLCPACTRKQSPP